MKRTSTERWLRGGAGIGGVLTATLGVLGIAVTAPLAAQSGGAAVTQVAMPMNAVAAAAPSVPADLAEVTYARDIAPILQQKCESCHRPGSIAPFPLQRYEEALPYARLIRLRTQERRMPPWPIDKTVGIQEFKDDMSLSDEQIALIAAWVDQGAPLGNPADLPQPTVWKDYSNTWRYEEKFGRPPDVIIENPPYQVLANGLDQWPEHLENQLSASLTEPGFIMAIEARPKDPGTRYTFHHGGPTLVSDGETFGLMNSPGKIGEVFPSDAGIPIAPGSTVRYSMHFYPIGEPVDAVVQWGIWLYPKDQPPRFITPGEEQFRTETSTGAGGFPGHSRDISRRADLIIPPNGIAMYQGTYVLDQAARLHSIRGHMHLRGMYQVVQAIYPDGRSEIINKLNWDHSWANVFHYEDHVMPLLPKGTVLLMTSVFDNTVNNRNNPDPDQWVVAGSRTVDEMAHIWLGITYFEDEEYFTSLVEERERTLARMAASDNDN